MGTALVSQETTEPSLNQTPFPEGLPSDVYGALAQHQRDENWQARELMAYLQDWSERFNIEFKLDVPKIALAIDRLPANRYGHFRPGHNGFGLQGEIALNSRYLWGERMIAEILGTLLHEMIHGWQEVHGTPSRHCHHNAEFRAKALECGLIIDERGFTSYSPKSPFRTLLGTFGISLPEGETHVRQKREAGQSKLRKYCCGCTNIRVAKREFRALCLLCNREFLSSEPSSAPASSGTQIVAQHPHSPG